MSVPIKFGTDGWRAIIAKDFTIENLSRVSFATAEWIKKNNSNPSAVVGYDSRFGGKMFAERVAQIFAFYGIKIFLPQSFVSTPMVSLAVIDKKASAGIIITASHNPPDYSGFKIKAHYGGPASPSMIAEVERNIPDEWSNELNLKSIDDYRKDGLMEYLDMERMYVSHLRKSFNLKLIEKSKIKLAHDAMFGAGQNVLKKIFPKATFVRCEFNPSFNGRAPEPIHKNLIEFSKKIKKEKIHLGIATDGDADRIGLYDEKGNFVDSHHIFLLLIKYLVEEKKLSGKVVCTFSCTQKIKKLCEIYRLSLNVTKIGFKYICEIMNKENVLIGGEESGGIAVTGHIPERDGIYVGLMIAEYMAKKKKKLTELVSAIYKVVGKFSVERNDLHISEEAKLSIIQNCKSGEYSSFGKNKVSRTENLDGFKYYFENGRWVLIRPSGTEPVLRIYAEAENSSIANEILHAIEKTILG